MPFVYILRCHDNSLYTGYTLDLKRRVAQHNQGTASKYTRGRRPVQLAYVEEYADKITALKREYAIKHMKKSVKEALLTAKSTNYIESWPPGEDI